MSRNPRRVKRDAPAIPKAAMTLGRCPCCNKDRFDSRGTAKAAAKARHPKDHLSPYRCPVDESIWHYGHLPAVVRNGHLTRESLERANEVRARRAEGAAYLEAESA